MTCTTCRHRKAAICACCWSAELERRLRDAMGRELAELYEDNERLRAAAELMFNQLQEEHVGPYPRIDPTIPNPYRRRDPCAPTAKG